jgi:hypothetical protein
LYNCRGRGPTTQLAVMALQPARSASLVRLDEMLVPKRMQVPA